MKPWDAVKFVPNPYTQGKWYPLNEFKVKLTRGRGRNSGKRYVTARRLGTVNLTDPDGNVLQQYEEYFHYRACLSDKDPKWKPID